MSVRLKIQVVVFQMIATDISPKLRCWARKAYRETDAGCIRHTVASLPDFFDKLFQAVINTFKNFCYTIFSFPVTDAAELPAEVFSFESCTLDIVSFL